VLIKHLPADSATVRLARNGEEAWGREHYLLSHVYSALTGKPHPWLAKAAQSNGKPSRYADLRRRLNAQRARLSQPD
jgi:hypothetical protein